MQKIYFMKAFFMDVDEDPTTPFDEADYEIIADSESEALNSARQKAYADKKGAGVNLSVDIEVDDISYLIKAEVHSDDRTASAQFNAAAWFKAADDQEIRRLIECGFGGDYVANRVAQFFEKQNTDIANVLAATGKISGSAIKANGFECRVNEDDAMEWLAEHKPHLIDKGN